MEQTPFLVNDDSVKSKTNTSNRNSNNQTLPNSTPRRFKTIRIVLIILASLVLIVLVVLLTIFAFYSCLFKKCHANASCKNEFFNSFCYCSEGYAGNGITECDECGLSFYKENVKRIVGGIEAVPHSWPSQVILIITITGVDEDNEEIIEQTICGGVIINKYYILTAGHCVNEDVFLESSIPIDKINIRTSVHHFISSRRLFHFDLIKNWTSSDINSTYVNEYDYEDADDDDSDNDNNNSDEDFSRQINLTNATNFTNILLDTFLNTEIKEMLKSFLLNSTLNVTNAFSDGQTLRIEKVINYGETNLQMHDDIALIRVNEPIKFNEKVQMACLPLNKPVNYPQPGKHGFIVGWGDHNENGQSKTSLQNSRIDILDEDACNETLNQVNLNNIITYDEENKLALRSLPGMLGIPKPSVEQIHFDFSSQICAGTQDGTVDSCSGDSGGPLFISDYVNGKKKHLLSGLVSFGAGCGRPNLPGVYTRISHYLDWILKNSVY